MRTFLRMSAIVAVAAASFAAAPAFAAANLVVNGDFNQETLNGTTINQSYQINASNYGVTNGVVMTGWTSQGNGFVYIPASGTSGTNADTVGATQANGGNNIMLWGPGNGSNNGLTISPTGGNFVGFDGAYNTGALTQTISGLTVGYSYQLSFYWASAQYQQTTGGTTEGWTVGFGSQTFSTPTISTASQGFDAWRSQTFNFQATSTSQVLSFLATGAPAGSPPFSLLDGVVLSAVPEPSTWAVVIGALAAFSALRFVAGRKRRTGASAA